MTEMEEFEKEVRKTFGHLNLNRTEPTDREKRKWKSYNKYCRKLAKLESKYRLDGWSVDSLLGYWSQVLYYGKAYPEYEWRRLCILRIVRSERGLTVTDVPYLEDFLKEER